MKGNRSSNRYHAGRRTGDVVHVDALDYTRFSDTGCSIAPECLKCPLVKCRYDMDKYERWELGIGKGSGHDLPMEKREQIRDMVRAEQLPMARIASVAGVSRRTVQRLAAELLA